MIPVSDIVSALLRIGAPGLICVGVVLFLLAQCCGRGGNNGPDWFDLLMSSSFLCLGGGYLLGLWALARWLLG